MSITVKDPAILFPRVNTSPSVSIHDYPRKYYQSVVRLIRSRDGTILESDTIDDSVGRNDYELIRDAIRDGNWRVFNCGSYHFVVHGISYATILSLSLETTFTMFYQEPSSHRPSAVASPKLDGNDLRLFDDVLVSLLRLYSMNKGKISDIKNVVPIGSVSCCEIIVHGGDFIRLFESKFCKKRLSYNNNLTETERLLLMMFRQMNKFNPIIFSGISGCKNCPNKNYCPQEL